MPTLDVTKSYRGNMTLYCLIPILFVNVMHKKKRPVVEQVFLIYGDGRLISHVSLKGEEHLDEDIVGGMLTAVKNLLFEVFVRKENGEEAIGLYKFEFGERRVILEMGKHFYMAIVLLGMDNKSLLAKSEAIVQDIEKKYGSVLDEWQGNLGDFKGVDEIISTLLPLDRLSEAERKAIEEEGKRKKIFELWSKMHDSIMQEGLIPKAHIWKNLKWELNIDDKKRSGKKNEESEPEEAEQSEDQE